MCGKMKRFEGVIALVTSALVHQLDVREYSDSVEYVIDGC